MTRPMVLPGRAKSTASQHIQRTFRLSRRKEWDGPEVSLAAIAIHFSLFEEAEELYRLGGRADLLTNFHQSSLDWEDAFLVRFCSEARFRPRRASGGRRVRPEVWVEFCGLQVSRDETAFLAPFVCEAHGLFEEEHGEKERALEAFSHCLQTGGDFFRVLEATESDDELQRIAEEGGTPELLRCAFR